MESLQGLIGIGLRASHFVTVLAIGLDPRMDDASYLSRRPGLLLRSFLAIAVILPGRADGRGVAARS